MEHVCDSDVSRGSFTIQVGDEWVTYQDWACSVCGRVTNRVIVHRRRV